MGDKSISGPQISGGPKIYKAKYFFGRVASHSVIGQFQSLYVAYIVYNRSGNTKS